MDIACALDSLTTHYSHPIWVAGAGRCLGEILAEENESRSSTTKGHRAVSGVPASINMSTELKGTFSDVGSA